MKVRLRHHICGLGLLAALTACSPQESSLGTPPGTTPASTPPSFTHLTSSPGPSAPATASESGAAHDPATPTLPGNVAQAQANDALEKPSCHQDGSDWVLKGTLKNSSEQQQSYAVSVVLVASGGSSVFGHADSTEVLAAGASKSLALRASAMPEGAEKNLQCDWFITAEKGSK